MGVTAAMRRRCQRAINQLGLAPDPSIPELLRATSTLVGMRIELAELPAEAVGVTGLLVVIDDVIYIFRAADLVPVHARHVVAHEVGHLLLGHGECRPGAGAGSAGAHAEDEAEVFAAMLMTDVAQPDVHEIGDREPAVGRLEDVFGRIPGEPM